MSNAATEVGRLPDGWRWVKLGEMCEVIAGQSPPSSTYRTMPEGLPFFQGKADFGAVSPIARTWCVAPKKIALPGDILISVRAPVGPTNIADVECCIGRGLAAIRCKKNANRDFILHALRHYEEVLVNKGTGSTFESINRDDLESFAIPLPPLAEQQRIATILKKQMTAVEKARAASRKRLEAVKALPAAFLRDVFPEADKSLSDGWQEVRLGEVCEINPRRPSINRCDETPTTFIPMEAVDAKSGVADSRVRPFGEIKKGYTYFAEGDVLFAKITPCMQNRKHAIARDLLDGIGFGTTEFHVLRPSEHIIAEWVHFFVRQPSVLLEATEHFTGSVGQQRLPQEYLFNRKIPLPPLAEQRRIVTILKKQMTTVEKAQTMAEEELEAIDAMPSAWLRQAFAGEV